MIAADAPDEALQLHHGDPLAEQRSMARAAGVIDRSNRGVVTIPGADRLTWLHQLLSQHVETMADGTGTEALVLDLNGRVEHHMVLSDLDGTVWIDTEPGRVAALAEYLVAMRFWSDVQPADVTADWAVLTLVGPSTAEVLTAAGLPVPAGDYATAALPGDSGSGGGLVRRMPWPGSDAADLIVARSERSAWWSRLVDAGAAPAGTMAYDALRAESLRPRLGVDTDDRTIPHEVGWIGSAVHLAKGCYRGQETVARVANLGRPPRRLVLLHFDEGDAQLPVMGDPVTLGERVVGRVGTVAQHHELGPIALALLKRSVPVDAELVAGVDERATPARVDPDSVPPEPDAPPPGRAAQLRGGLR